MFLELDANFECLLESRVILTVGHKANAVKKQDKAKIGVSVSSCQRTERY